MALYVAATPIGNLSDASQHFRETIPLCELILAEDTRIFRQLLSALGLNLESHQRVISCHGHNERSLEAKIKNSSNQNILLVSDAATPCISDPGSTVVRYAHKYDIQIIPVAGPSALSTAVSVAGFQTKTIHYLGFPPRKSGLLRKWLIEKSALSGQLVFFESGRRLGTTIEALQSVMSDREICMCREMTKTFEEIVRRPVVDFSTEPVRGEVVVVVGPGAVVAQQLEQKNQIKQIAANLAELWGITKREAYNKLMSVKP